MDSTAWTPPIHWAASVHSATYALIITVMLCRHPLRVLWLWILPPGLHQSTGLPLCNLVRYNCYVLQESAVSSVAMDSTAWTPPMRWAASVQSCPL